MPVKTQPKPDAPRAALRKLLGSQPFAVLATQGGGEPYTSLVAFAATPDLSAIIFPTRAGTRKFDNLGENPRVALLIDNRTNSSSDYRDAIAVTAIGIAAAQPVSRGRHRRLLTAKHPSLAAFLAEPDCRIAVVRVSEYRLVTKFERVRVIRPAHAVANRPATRA